MLQAFFIWKKTMAIYSDINQYEPIAKETVVDIETIYQSIDNIFSTNVGDRVFNRIGSELEELLHEPMDEDTEFEIYSYVIHAIEKWEPRVRLNYGQCTITANYDEQRYDVVLMFEVVGLEGQDFKYEGALEE